MPYTGQIVTLISAGHGFSLNFTTQLVIRSKGMIEMERSEWSDFVTRKFQRK